MNEGVIAPNRAVAALFGNPWVGFYAAIVIVAGALAIIAFNYFKFHRPLAEALQTRLDATADVGAAESEAEAQDTFAAHFEEIDRAMMSGGAKAIELRHAWIEFGETFVDKNETPLQATTRPEGYFLHLGDDTRVLAWWANIFVALGLTLTFFGIIAALANAVVAISAGGTGGGSGMQIALINLLAVTGAKFWTSIGGVVGSIVLRMADRHWHSKIQRELETISDRIERGTLFFPPQRFAALQLRELRQQSIALTEFSHQLAASIGDALERNMAPVVAGLTGLEHALGSHLAPLTDIRTSIDEFRSGSLNDFGSKLGDAIKENAGAEMKGLADALTRMTSDLGSVNDRLEGASGQASEQIATAAREFTVASEQMSRTFASLGAQISGMSDRLERQSSDFATQAEQQRSAEVARLDAMAESNRTAMVAMADDLRQSSTAATDTMNMAFAALADRVASISERIAIQADEASERNLVRVAEDRASYEAMAVGQRDVMRAMGEEMRAASSAASAEMVRAVQSAVREAMDESQTAIRGALEGFAGATSGIQSAFDHMRGQVADIGDRLSDSASDAANRNEEVLARAAAALESAASGAQARLGATLEEAITRSADASSRAISEAFAAFGEKFEAASAGLVTTLTSTAGRMETLAGSIARSTEAANDHAGKLAHAGREAQAVSTMLGRAANDVSGAAAPIREAASTIKESVRDSQDLLRQASEATARQQTAMETISAGLERTGTAATQAWDNYRTRFTEVDEALGRALEQIRAASAEHATALNTEVGRIDTALAKAAEKLGAALDPLTDLANALEDVRGRFERQAAE